MIQIEELLKTAKEHGASDVHITVGIPPKMRIGGSLRSMDFEKLMPSEIEPALLSIMNPRQKQQLDEKGEVDFSVSIPGEGRYRVNVFRQRGSYAAALRLVGTVIPDVNELGIPQSVMQLYKKKRGLILITGPAGSGKSTTLAAIIDKINHNINVHVITLEDPIEYLYQHKMAIVNQREIGLDTTSYHAALRAALREDPDVIMVGEMRDAETIATALTAAEMGHLVLSSLHTVGAANTIERIIDVFPPQKQQQVRIQLASVLESVVSQQLIPTQDKHHRAAAFEVMHMTPSIKSFIRDDKTHQITNVMKNGKKFGMQTMDDAIFDLYLRGIINREQAIIFAQDVAEMERKLI
ncbi:MAG: type IV pilus twitching motility protein PilT [Lachnospiraceae bacterium]|nr:type IV pilus twitching motility protein PilT [Lachnospiraceae bacterium]